MACLDALIRRCAFLLIALALAPVCCGAEFPKLIEIEGIVEVRRKGAADWTRGKVGDQLQTGDSVRTRESSRLSMRLSDGSVIRKGELTTVIVSPPKTGSEKPTLDIIGGLLYFFSRDKRDETQIRVPGAAGAIRGTEFSVAVGADGVALLTMIDGVVELENEHGKETLRSGDRGEVRPGSAPRRTSVLMSDALKGIQWALYYPAVIDPREFEGLGGNLAEVVRFYREGDIPQAASMWPASYTPANDRERLLREQLQLASGAATKVTHPDLRTVLAAVRNETSDLSAGPLARSYYLQARGDLPGALSLARSAGNFGFAWARVAELEFSFGRIAEAREAIEKAIQLAPRHAQAHALRGFLAAAGGRRDDALKHFELAQQLDGGLGNAWLGSGLIKISNGRSREGLADLQQAVVVEPQRAVLRSYLAKAVSGQDSQKEIGLALKIDPRDPTAWLYSALIDSRGNRINDAISNLERSKELNKERALYRSQMLLDQDQAVRRANLASIYRDAGMIETSVREASRAVQDDYANSSAHLFLAGAYDSLRDPSQNNFRYETAWFSELLLADLLAPPGQGTLSQTISQQEYSRLFTEDGLHLASGTEYRSSGHWSQYGSQWGSFGGTSYALDAVYSATDADHLNSDFEQVTVWGRFKQAISPKDSVFLLANYYDASGGDSRQIYDPANPFLYSSTIRIRENQEPNVFGGFRHEWQPGSLTLFLAGHLHDRLRLRDSASQIPVLVATGPADAVVGGAYLGFNQTYRSLLEAWTAEAQHIQQIGKHRLIGGARIQSGSTDTASTLAWPGFASTPAINTNMLVSADLERLSAYAYAHAEVREWLQLIGGLSYDRLVSPETITIAPIRPGEGEIDRFSPKAGFILGLASKTFLRGAYTRSLGGVFYDSAVRLEPVQVAGFVQAFRSAAPESIAGTTAGTRFESWNLGLDHQFPTRTYVGVEGNVLTSEGDRLTGMAMFPNRIPGVPEAAEFVAVGQTLDFRERSVTATINQLLGESWSLGARYRLSEAELESATPAISQAIFPEVHLTDSASLHHGQIFAALNHYTGFFAEGDANLYSQSGSIYSSNQETFWQFNLFAGWRFFDRRAEAAAGVMNLSDRDYRLNPLNFAPVLPRERTFVARLKFVF